MKTNRRNSIKATGLTGLGLAGGSLLHGKTPQGRLNHGGAWRSETAWPIPKRRCCGISSRAPGLRRVSFPPASV